MVLRLTAAGENQQATIIDVAPEGPVTVGRGNGVDYSFPADSYMSGRHFQVEWRDGQWLVKDLESSNGVFVNGDRVQEAALLPGHEVKAGSTVFQVEIHAPVPMTPPEQLMRLLQAAGTVFGVMDAGRSPEMLDLLQANGEQAVSLFDDSKLADLKEQAPHLVSFGGDETLLRSFVYTGWEQSCGVYLSTEAEAGALTAHLRQLLIAEMENRERFLFRYYDPRVLRVYLPTCTPEEASSFFGPVSAFFCESEQPNQWLKFTPGPEGPRAEAADLSAAQQSDAEDTQ